MAHRRRRARSDLRAYSVIEILVVVTVIGLAAGLGVASTAAITKEAARRGAEAELEANLQSVLMENARGSLVTIAVPIPDPATGTTVVTYLGVPDDPSDANICFTDPSAPGVRIQTKLYSGILIDTLSGDDRVCWNILGQPRVLVQPELVSAATLVLSDPETLAQVSSILVTKNAGIESGLDDVAKGIMDAPNLHLSNDLGDDVVSPKIPTTLPLCEYSDDCAPPS